MKLANLDPTVQIQIEFSNKVRECLEQAIEYFGVYELEYTEITYDLKGQCAGQAIHTHDNRLKLRINLEAVRKDFQDMVNETIPHEVAHLVCFLRPSLGRNHNRGWKNVCQALGGTASRTHSIELTRAKKVKRFVYILEDGSEVKLTKGKHEKIQSGMAKMWLPAQHCNSKQQQDIEKQHFVKMIEVK